MNNPDTTIFKALAVEQRARIVSFLSGRSLCAGALARMLEITPGALSQHLAILKKSGLVIGEKRGYFTHYRLAPQAQRLAKDAVDKIFSDHPDKPEKQNCAKTCKCPKHTTEEGSKQS